MEYEKKQDKESSGIFTYTAGWMELPIPELEKGEGEADLGAKIKSLVLDVVNLRCMLENLTHATITLHEIY